MEINRIQKVMNVVRIYENMNSRYREQDTQNQNKRKEYSPNYAYEQNKKVKKRTLNIMDEFEKYRKK